jgi:hypothetical protein
MKTRLVTLAALVAFLAPWAQIRAAEAPPIRKVEIGPNRELRVNGEPFFPIMLWLQSEERIGDGLRSGINTFCGYGSDELSRKEFLDQLGQNGLYGIVHFGDDHRDVLDHPARLGWIQGDEPDLPRKVNDAVVTPGPGMRTNPSNPLSQMLNGETGSWPVIDPLLNGQFTIKLKAPVTVESIALWPLVYQQMPVAKEVVFTAGGKEILKATLEKKRGQQKFALAQPATFSELNVKITSIYEGEGNWGCISEIQGFDEAGKNFLVSPTRYEPRTSPEACQEQYARIKQADKMRPVLLTSTGAFFEANTRYDLATRQRLYPEFMKACDVAGFDIYPIYGSSFPSRMNHVADATEELVRLAGRRPVYAWIETNKGSRWMTYERQLDVEPKHTRCETWMAIIRGATAIGYFTHRWRPDYKQFAPTDEMVAEMKRLNDQITRLAPAILAAPATAEIEMTLGDGLPCHLKATEHEGALYIFAENIDLGPEPEKKRQFEQIVPRAGKAVITVQGLTAGTRIEVVDEARTITADDGRFTDDFPPLREHIYRIVM